MDRAQLDRAQLQFIADHLPALVAYVGADGRYGFCNTTYSEWLGMSQAQMLGKPIEEAWEPERFARIKPNIDRALDGHRVEFESEIERPTGKRTLRTNYVPDFDDAGKVRGYFI